MTQQIDEVLVKSNGVEEITSEANIISKPVEQVLCSQGIESQTSAPIVESTQDTGLSIDLTIEVNKPEVSKSELSTEQTSNKKRPKLTNIFNKDKTVEVRQGKLNFIEPKVNYQIHPTTIIELGKFHLAKYNAPSCNSIQIEEILRINGPLIGKLIHESDLLLSELSLYVKEILCPTGFDVKDPWQDILLLSMVENIINEVAERVSYSVVLENPDNSEPLTSESLSVYRWEVRDVHITFHSSIAPSIINRKEKRNQMKNEAQTLYNELPEDERSWMVSMSSLKKRRKIEHCTSLLKSKDLTVEPKPILKTPVLKQPTKAPAKPAVEEKPTPKNTTSIKGFFSPVRKNQRSPTQVISDYHKFFQAFRVKQNVSVAKNKNVNVNLLTDFNKAIYPNYEAYIGIDAEGFLKQFLANCQKQKQLQLDLGSSDLVTINLDESEDEDSCADFDSQNCGVRPKLLHFHENYRPAFFGAWQKESSIINGRNFLSKDTELLDYDFDSEEEWQEEEEGELLADSEEDEEDDEDFNDKEDGSDSDNDDWIITEDEDFSQVGSDNENANSGKSRTKNKKVLNLKPIIYGVCFDSQTASTIKVTKNQLLSTLAYSTFQENISFPIDPFSPILTEPITPSIAPSTTV